MDREKLFLSLKSYKLTKETGDQFVFEMVKPRDWYGVTFCKTEQHRYTEEDLVELYFQIEKLLKKGEDRV